MHYVIRPLTAADEPILWEMLFHAVQQPGESHGREILERPEVARYADSWGREGDRGFLATDTATNEVIGAAWLRLPIGEYKGYGYIDETTPELAFAVHPQFRQHGIATALLTQLVRSTPHEAAIALSLAAAGDRVRRLYERFGFKVVKESETAIKMQR